MPAPAPPAPAVGSLAAKVLGMLDAPNVDINRCLEMVADAPVVHQLGADNLAPMLKDTVNNLQQEAGQLEGWFNATMDRVSARFTMYARLWTVVFAVLFAAVSGLNSVTLIKTLYTNGDFRAAVVGTATQMTDLASRVGAAGANDPAVFKMYADVMTKALKDSGAATNPGSPAPGGINSDQSADDWIKKNVVAADQQKVSAAFTADIQTQRTQDVAAVRNIVQKSGFDLLSFHWEDGQVTWPQIPGVLATAALLSLGAPFWFNALKQLTNLRPILANKTDAPASK